MCYDIILIDFLAINENTNSISIFKKCKEKKVLK